MPSYILCLVVTYHTMSIVHELVYDLSLLSRPLPLFDLSLSLFQLSVSSSFLFIFLNSSPPSLWLYVLYNLCSYVLLIIVNGPLIQTARLRLVLC